MKKAKFLFVSIISFFLVFSSCSKEEEKAQVTTVKQDKENLEAAMNNFYSCLKTLNDGGFADFIYSSVFKEDVVDVVVNPKGGSYKQKENWVNFVLEKFTNQYGKFLGGFDYPKFKGKYTWNVADKKWERGESTIVELYFPSKKDGTSNNVKFIVDSYEDTPINHESEKINFPTKGHVYAEIDNEKVFELSFKNIRFDVKTNFSMPLNGEVILYTKPFTHNINFKRVTPLNFDLTYTLKSEASCEYAMNYQIVLNNSDYGNFSKLKKDVKLVKGYFAHNALKFNYTADISKFNNLNKELEDLSDADVNSLFNAELSYNNLKISDVTFDSSIDDDNKIYLYLTFKDGSKESLSKYVGDFREKIKEIFKRFSE